MLGPGGGKNLSEPVQSLMSLARVQIECVGYVAYADANRWNTIQITLALTLTRSH